MEKEKKNIGIIIVSHTHNIYFLINIFNYSGVILPSLFVSSNLKTPIFVDISEFKY